MRVFVDTKFGSTFTFDLSPINKLSDIKKRIENSHGIPVSTQKLFFDGVELLVDRYQLPTYRILSNSRLLLEVRDDHVNNQMLHQSPYATQGFVPSIAMRNYDQLLPSHASSSFFNQDPHTMAKSNQVPQSHASASFHNQDPRTMARSNQVPPSHASEAFYNQDRLESNDGQVLDQPDVLESFSMDEFLERAPLPWTAQETRKMEGSWPGTTGDNVNIQESCGRDNENQDLAPPPQKLTVIMTHYDKPGGDFLVDVNASDNVEELRKELEKMQQKYQLDLPAEGYFFKYKERVLVDDKSFSMNRVANGDTIEILPEPDIKDFYT
ncbi:hypothetical protein BRARA_C02780 [Brassica rapa]|uniref:Ubiquitin-like domain-containing protein n=2 Tax=Brassica campestris TaxID=3711 RepID=A0A397ZYZ6_BRACM|nr:hypothetical protein BRARA_C02780 [Brassica rapa]